MLHHPHVFCNHVRFSRIPLASSRWAGQVCLRLIPCCCSLAAYGWWAWHTAQGRTLTPLRFRHASTHCVLDFSLQVTPETPHLRTCMGILHDLPQIHASYDMRATQYATRRVASSWRPRHERSLAQWQQPLVQHAWLIAASTLTCMLGLVVCGAADEELEVQAHLPTCEVWWWHMEA